MIELTHPSAIKPVSTYFSVFAHNLLAVTILTKN